MSVNVVTKRACPFCDKAKALLRESNIEFSEIDVTNNEAYCAEMKRQSLTVPRIYHGDHFVGGFEELCDYLIDEGMISL